MARDGDNLVCYAGGSALQSVAWTNFDGGHFCQWYAGAELHNSPCDRTPGSSANPNHFQNIQIHSPGKNWTNGVLFREHNDADNGRIESTGSNSFKIWDIRN